MSEVQSFKPLHFFQRGGRKIVIPVDDVTAQAQLNRSATHLPLVYAIARAFYWAKLIDLGVVSSGSEIAEKEGLDPSTVNERLRLSLLSPAIIESILNGTQPQELTMQWLTRNTFPSDWEKQKSLFRCQQEKDTPQSFKNHKVS